MQAKAVTAEAGELAGKHGEPVVAFNQVSHVYKTGREETKAIEGVDFAIERGQFVSVIGHNGSGKSTLAKHINGLLLPSEGIVTVCGIETNDTEMIWEIRRQAGMVFQNPDNQLVAASVEDDVAFGLENLGIPPDEINLRIEQAMAQVGITHLRDHEPHRLSGGQKQRVAISGIMAMKPAVLILDEATAMLDPAGRKQVMETAHHLNRSEGITVIHITHHLDETLESHRLLVMHEGRVIFEGEPSQVYADAEKMTAIGLDVPFAVQLRYRLKQRGLHLTGNGMETTQLAEDVWTLLSKS